LRRFITRFSSLLARSIQTTASDLLKWSFVFRNNLSTNVLCFLTINLHICKMCLVVTNALMNQWLSLLTSQMNAIKLHKRNGQLKLKRLWQILTESMTTDKLFQSQITRSYFYAFSGDFLLLLPVIWEKRLINAMLLFMAACPQIRLLMTKPIGTILKSYLQKHRVWLFLLKMIVKFEMSQKFYCYD